MNYVLTLDSDTEKVTIVYDDSITIFAKINLDGEIVFSKNFEDEIIDDTFVSILKLHCRQLLKTLQ